MIYKTRLVYETTANNYIHVLFSGMAAAPDFESSAYGSVLYFLEGVLPFLEAFYRDFYFPDAATHPNELDETDHIAKAIVVCNTKIFFFIRMLKTITSIQLTHF